MIGGRSQDGRMAVSTSGARSGLSFAASQVIVGLIMNITEALVVEHSALRRVFDQLEALLPEAESVGEVRRLAFLVEKVLEDHARSEEDLAYAALDHVLAEAGDLDQLYQDHREISGHLGKAQKARDLETARGWLKTSLRASREHFRREEQSLFPLINLRLQAGMSQELARAFSQVAAPA